MNSWIHLSMAIVAEIIATSALKSSEGFTGVVVMNVFSKSVGH
ncbi:mebrane transport protein [Bordetella pertussis]|nr:mebrane transport protein [Bordetella pertussis]